MLRRLCDTFDIKPEQNEKTNQWKEPQCKNSKKIECVIDIDATTAAAAADDSHWLTHTEQLWLRHFAECLTDRKATKSKLLSFKFFGMWMWEWTACLRPLTGRMQTWWRHVAAPPLRQPFSLCNDQLEGRDSLDILVFSICFFNTCKVI